MPHCFRLEMQLTSTAFCFALPKAGSNIAARMAMMAITTSNSISVNPERILFGRSVMVTLKKQILCGKTCEPRSCNDVCRGVCAKHPDTSLNLLRRESLREQMERDDEGRVIAPINHVESNFVSNLWWPVC